MADQVATEMVHCNQCKRETKHIQIYTRQHDGSESPDTRYPLSWTTINDLYECCGCEEVTLRRRFHFSEWDHDEEEVRFFPPRVGRNLPIWKAKLPEDTCELLEEVYAALQADSRRIAMMGVRAIIDMVMVEKVGDAGSFKDKLDKLESEGFLGKKNCEVLGAALDVGHAASHRGFKPEIGHVHVVFDIVENLLQSTLLEDVVSELKSVTPKRGANSNEK